MPKLMAVYGTLKRGHGNNRLMKDSEFLGQVEIKGFVMHSLGGFPAIKHGEGTITAEIFSVPAEYVPDIDALEGYREFAPETSMYLRETVETSFGEAFIYVWNRTESLESRPLIENGVW